jgi:hypothetical protein
MKAMIQFVWLLLLSLLVWQCGGKDFDPKSLLNTYRVVAIQASPPSVGLTERTQIKLWDFHPNDVLKDKTRPKIKYSWTLCPFSIGALTSYRCEIEELALDEFEDQQEFEFSPFELFIKLGEKFKDEFEQASSMLSPDMDDFKLNVISVYLKLSIKVGDDEAIQAVKKVTIHFDDMIAKNKNPKITDLEIKSSNANFTTESEVELRAVIDNDQVETYIPIDPTATSTPAEQEEDLIIAWFTSAGELEPAVTLLNSPDTALTLGEEPSLHRVFLTVRDGRGGVDVQTVDIEVEEAK